MKKRLLIALMGMATAFSASAYEVGTVVTTPQGRFQVVGANVCSNSTCIDGFDGWNVITASEGLTCKDIFVHNGEGLVANNSASTEGMYYTFNTADANTTYLVSMKIKQAAASSPNEATRLWAHGMTTNVNLINVVGNSSATPSITAVGSDSIMCGIAQEIYPEVDNEITAVIRPDGVARTYYINLVGVNSAFVISDIEIQEVNELADLRAAQVALDYANTILNCVEWTESDELAGLKENVAAIEAAMADSETTAEAMVDFVEGLQGATADFLAARMDDFFPNANDKLPIAAAKTQKINNIGNWKGYGGGNGRIHSNANDYYDVGHYQMAAAWGNGNGCIGLTNDTELVPGTYVFSAEIFGGCRENVKNSWDLNTGLHFARGHYYLKNVETGDTVAITEDFLLDPVNFEKHNLVAKVEKEGKYQLGIMTYAKEGYETLKLGSTIYVYNASFYAKTASQWTKAQMDYYTAVVEQVTAARTNLTEAAEHIADASKSWGKAALQEVVNEVEPKTAAYEAMDEATIIATFDPETYEAGATKEASQMVYEVYTNTAQQIIAANRAFVAQNDTLETLANEIAIAEKMYNRYTAASGRADLEAALTAAKATNEAMKAAGYSEENAATVVAAVAALQEAEATFKTTVAVETIVNVDFETAPVLNEETALYEVKGNPGVMVLPNFYENTATINDVPGGASAIGFEIGIDANGEKDCAGMLRLGNGTATVPVTVAENFSDILNISFDYYYGNLSGRYAGYKLIANDSVSVICAFYGSKYDGKADPNTFNVDINAAVTGVGSSTASNAAIGAESNKTTFDILIDYATGEMTCTTTSAKGVFTTNATLADKALLPCELQILTNYNNADRRCWFDNLKVSVVKAGEYVDGITNVVANKANNGKIYTISGVQVKSATKGMYIINGRKYVVK